MPVETDAYLFKYREAIVRKILVYRRSLRHGLRRRENLAWQHWKEGSGNS